MHLRVLVITLIFSALQSWAVESFSGFIVQNGSQRSLKTKTNQFVLTTENSDVRVQLLKLRSNDFISGIGHSLSTGIVRLDTIDFVGLSNFLGTWASSMGIFQVQDFSSLSLYSAGQVSKPKPASLNYSITPADGNSWGMFLTDTDRIYFSKLVVAESRASIRFFDTQTGAFKREVMLSKISK